MAYKLQSILKDEIRDYLHFRDVNAFTTEKPHYVLNAFDRHLVNCNFQCKSLDQKTVMTYLQLREGEKTGNLRNRSSTIHSFLLYLQNIKGISTFTKLPRISRKSEASFVPYIFSDDEISKILFHAQHFPHHVNMTLPNIENIVSCAITMLYCTGMRAGEVINLKVEDVDLDQQLIYVHEAKNHNKRLIPMSDSLTAECRRYVEQAEKLNLKDVYFFDTGSDLYDGKLNITRLYLCFRKLLKMSGIQHRGRGNGPRMHDLRHTFTCHSLRQLSRLDGDINAYLVYLSTYLGHKSLLETQQYIWLTGELFEDTRLKMDQYTKFIDDIYKEAEDIEDSI